MRDGQTEKRHGGLMSDEVREGYYDYMLRRYREENAKMNIYSKEDILKKEIAEMQKQNHQLMVRIIELLNENKLLRKQLGINNAEL